MEISGNILVFVILAAVFAAVGIHLLLWSRRRSRQIRRFAREQALDYQAFDDGQLEKRINELAAIDDPGMGRCFGRVRDIVAIDGGVLFRGVEAIDLVPWGQPQNTHHPRTGVLFEADIEPEGVFLVSTDGHVEQRHPGEAARAAEIRTALDRANVPPPPCPLSLTVRDGRILACLEPFVTGRLREQYFDYLLNLVKALKQ